MTPESGPTNRARAEQFQRRHRTGLATVLFTDLVDSVALRRQLGDQAGTSLLQAHRQLVRQTLECFAEAEEIETAGDSFLLLFARPSDAVRFALLVQSQVRVLARGRKVALADRIGVHVGEVVIEEHDRGRKPKDLYGAQIDLCARVTGLAQGGQILLTQAVFDSARQALKGEEVEGIGELSWLNHGAYLLKGIEEAVEVCEVGEVGTAPLSAPTGSDKAQRQVSPEAEPVLGWRPAIGQHVPNTQWTLEKKLGEGGFGEVWLGRHQVMKERRVFKFCFKAERVRFLKREMTLFRLLKERVGDHPNIVSLREVYFNEPPFFVEMDYVEGQDLRTWCEARGSMERIPLETRLEIVAQIAEALQAAHDAGVIHRDVKPANILICNLRLPICDLKRAAEPRFNDSPEKASGVDTVGSGLQLQIKNQKSKILVKLTDFGIGQVVSEEALAGITRAGFTKTILADSSSSHTGTQLYMAPELLAGKPASIRSDIYSLGVVLYQLLVGDFTRPMTMDWAKDISDPLLREDLQHCFTGNPNERFAGAGQLAKHLRALPQRQRALAEQQAKVAATERAAYRRGIVRTAAVAFLIVAVIGFLAANALNQSHIAKTEAQRANRSALEEARQHRLAEEREWVARQNLYFADMNLAQQAFENGNLGRAVELLEKYRPEKKSEIRGSKSEVELRGWEWRYLWRLTRSDEIGTLGSHSNVVTCLACSPVAPLLASGSQDAAVKFWDLVARSNIATLPFPESIRSLAFAPDGKLLAIGCEDQSVRLYDLTAKREVARFPSKQFTGRFEGAVAFSAGGRTLAFNDPSSNIILWDVTTQSQIGFLDGPPGGITTLAFSPIGSTLASGGDGGNVRLWNLSTKSAIRDLDGGGEINAVAFSPDGKSLVSAGEPVKAWDVGTGRELARLTGHGAIVNAVAFSPDGKLIAGAVGQLIKLWDATTWTEINTLQGHFKNVWALAFSADGKILASGGKDETVRLWNLLAKREERSQLALPRRRKLIFGSVAFSTDGKTLLTLSDAGEAKVWDTVSLAEKSSVFLTDSNILEVAVDSGGTLIASGHADGKIKLWDCALRREMGNLNGHTGAVTSLRFSLDKKLLASASLALGSPAIKADHTIRLWDVAGHRQLSSFNNVPIYYSSAEFSPNNEILAVGGYPDGTVRLLGVRNGQELGTLKGHKRPVDGVAFSPDGRTLATASWDENVKLWDVGSQTEIATLRGHRTAVHSAVFSPDGRRIVSSAAEDSLKLWDVTTSQEVASLAVGRPFFWAYFADNDTIVTLVNAGKDEVALNLRVLRAASLAEIDAAEKAKARGK